MPTITERITELRENRAHSVTEQRQLIDTALAESRDLTAEERQTDERLEQQFVSDTDELRRLERSIERDAELRATAPPAAAATTTPEETRNLSPRERRAVRLASDEYRDAFFAGIRGLASDEQRALLDADQRDGMAVGVDADGGYTVPEAFRADFITHLEEESIIRSLANVITTGSGNPIKWPKLITNAAKPTITDEFAPIDEVKPVWGNVDLSAFKWAEIIRASDEFAQDTAVSDLQAFISSHMAMLFAQAQGAKYIAGTGTGEPQGLMANATVGKVAAASSAITMDETVDLQYSVRRPYRRNGVWIAHDLTLAAVSKLKDSTGQYLWQPSLQDGEPDRFRGRPIYSDPDVSQLGGIDRIVLGYGDVRRAYTIREVAGGLQIRYLVERYADTGEVGWRGTFRSDGRITDDLAFKTLKTSHT